MALKYDDVLDEVNRRMWRLADREREMVEEVVYRLLAEGLVESDYGVLEAGTLE